MCAFCGHKSECLSSTCWQLCGNPAGSWSVGRIVPRSWKHWIVFVLKLGLRAHPLVRNFPTEWFPAFSADSHCCATWVRTTRSCRPWDHQQTRFSRDSVEEMVGKSKMRMVSCSSQAWSSWHFAHRTCATFMGQTQQEPLSTSEKSRNSLYKLKELPEVFYSFYVRN